MANYSNDFQAIGAASGMPSGFTNRWYSTATFSTVDSGSGNIALRQNNSPSNHVGISMDAVDGDANRADGEVLVKVRSSADASSNTYGGAMARGSGSAGSHTMYVATLYGQQLELTKFVSGTYTQLAATTSIINDSGETSTFAGTFYWIRFQYIGSALKVRIWRHNQTEPATWDINVTDSSISAAGWAGVFAYTGSANVDYADLAVSTNSDTASMGGGGGGSTMAGLGGKQMTGGFFDLSGGMS